MKSSSVNPALSPLHDGHSAKAKCVICGNFNRFWHIIEACNFCQSCVSEALSGDSPAAPETDELALTRKKVERLQRWAVKAGHFPECAHWKPWTQKGCTCGLVDLMLGLPSAGETKPNEVELFDGESHIHRRADPAPKVCPNCFGDKMIYMSDGSKRTCEFCGGSGVSPVENGKGD